MTRILNFNAKKTAYEADLETKQAIENTMQMLKS